MDSLASPQCLEQVYGCFLWPEKGRDPVIVCWQVELLDFEGEMMTEDRGVIRRIKTKGEGFTNPNDGATVDGKSLLVFTQLPYKYHTVVPEAQLLRLLK